MPTPLNQSVADSALLTRSLPLGMLRTFVQSDAADEGLTPALLAELKVLARVPGLIVACKKGKRSAHPDHGRPPGGTGCCGGG